MYDGLAFAGLYIRKEYDGPGTQKRSYSNKDILVHPGLYRNRGWAEFSILSKITIKMV